MLLMVTLQSGDLIKKAYYCVSHHVKLIMKKCIVLLYLILQTGLLKGWGQEAIRVVVLAPDPSLPEVQLFQKFELGVELPPVLVKQVDTYLQGHDPYPASYFGLNPFDPEDISLEATFLPPGYPGVPEQRVYGFYFKDYESIRTSYGFDYWKELPTKWNWRIRFAPDKAGEWLVRINVRVDQQYLYSAQLSFNCIPGNDPGRLVVDPSQNRYLKFDAVDSSFFGIGMNICWPWHCDICRAPEPDQFEQHRKMLIQLAQGGGNLVRIMFRMRSYALEWEELNNYDHPFALKENLPEPDQRIGRLALARELDKTIETLEGHNLYGLLTFENQFSYMYFNGYFPNDEFLWPNNPYRKIEGVDSLTDFFQSVTARRHFQNKLRYFFARWGYSTHFAGFELANELEFRGQSMKEGKRYSPYHEEKSFRMHLIQWHYSMNRFLRDSLKVKQLLSTGYGNLPLPDDTLYHSLDYLTPHTYAYAQNRNIKDRPARMRSVMERWNKPFIFGEIGLGDRKKDIYKCLDIAFHNDTWATTLMGGFGTGLGWWWSLHLSEGHTAVYPKIKEFIENTRDEENPYLYSQVEMTGDDHPVEYFILVNQNRDGAIGWVHNTQVYWKNLYRKNSACIDSIGLDTEFDRDIKLPRKICSIKIGIEGLNDSEKQFRVDWYNTRTGEWTKGRKLHKECGKNTFLLKVPALGFDIDNLQTPPDYAFRIIALDR
jgi:hypothetical protein